IQTGDVITAINGETVTDLESLRMTVTQHRPDDVLVLSIERNGEALEISVSLGDMRLFGAYEGGRDDNRRNGQRGGLRGPDHRLGERPFLGLTIRVEGEQLIVSDVPPDPPASLAGLQAGDVITAINGNPVHDG